MNWVGALLGVLGLLVGVCLGLVIAALLRRGQHVDRLTVPQAREVTVPEGTRRVLEVIRAAGGGGRAARRGARVDAAALKLGLTRGSRVVIPRILEMVREARRESSG